MTQETGNDTFTLWVLELEYVHEMYGSSLIIFLFVQVVDNSIFRGTIFADDNEYSE